MTRLTRWLTRFRIDRDVDNDGWPTYDWEPFNRMRFSASVSPHGAIAWALLVWHFHAHGWLRRGRL